MQTKIIRVYCSDIELSEYFQVPIDFNFDKTYAAWKRNYKDMGFKKWMESIQGVKSVSILNYDIPFWW